MLARVEPSNYASSHRNIPCMVEANPAASIETNAIEIQRNTTYFNSGRNVQKDDPPRSCKTM